MRKEVAIVRKKIDMANRDLKPLGQSCQKKVFASINILACTPKSFFGGFFFGLFFV